ncbi:Hypothetical protein ORPV_630 [Orpheovirus IHUMI-LCC2]|uniref:Uncharacterized protein n=1 Tax=Orpheovirus IHUMI-LCC2 TaxID=2023057 RepID=A0A2I2L4S8_9VIRU|nr:Hypothetical protein ORPV_630 [Orpheovirus IHUMI-LCC2]SNW62534.1 Hypothetical protein ORPV_630 [Orpheovirus IHUMI-LCC2]
MFEVKNERNEIISLIDKFDRHLLVTRVPIFSLEKCNLQIADFYCGNIQNSKIALHTFLCLLHKDEMGYNKHNLCHAIKLMSALCPELYPHDIMFIKKIMDKYDNINILREHCPWMFDTYHSVFIDHYKYSDNKFIFDRMMKDTRTDGICYYYKDTFIQYEHGKIHLINIKTETCTSYDTCVNWCYLDDQNFYFEDDALHIEIKSFQSKSKFRFKFVFIDETLPIVIPLPLFINDNKNIEHILFTNTSKLSNEHELIVEHGDNIIYKDKVCNVAYNKSIFLTNNIIVKFDIVKNSVQIFKII